MTITHNHSIDQPTIQCSSVENGRIQQRFRPIFLLNRTWYFGWTAEKEYFQMQKQLNCGQRVLQYQEINCTINCTIESYLINCTIFNNCMAPNNNCNYWLLRKPVGTINWQLIFSHAWFQLTRIMTFPRKNELKSEPQNFAEILRTLVWTLNSIFLKRLSVSKKSSASKIWLKLSRVCFHTP